MSPAQRGRIASWTVVRTDLENGPDYDSTFGSFDTQEEAWAAANEDALDSFDEDEVPPGAQPYEYAEDLGIASYNVTRGTDDGFKLFVRYPEEYEVTVYGPFGTEEEAWAEAESIARAELSGHIDDSLPRGQFIEETDEFGYEFQVR